MYNNIFLNIYLLYYVSTGKTFSHKKFRNCAKRKIFNNENFVYSLPEGYKGIHISLPLAIILTIAIATVYIQLEVCEYALTAVS